MRNSRLNNLFVKQMSGVVIRRSIPRQAAEGEASVTPGGEIFSQDHSDLLSRAAFFRLEADALRQRAQVTDEMVVRDQYFKLADRWTTLAAGLEADLLTQMIDAR